MPNAAGLATATTTASSMVARLARDGAFPSTHETTYPVTSQVMSMPASGMLRITLMASLSFCGWCGQMLVCHAEVQGIDSCLDRSRAALETNDLLSAEKSLREAVGMCSNSIEPNIELGALLLGTGRLEEGQDALRRAANLLVRAGDTNASTEIIRAMENTRDIRSRVALLLDQKGLGYLQARAWKDAERIARLCTLIDPGWSEGHRLLGSALDGRGLVWPAITAAVESVRLSPKSPDAHSGLAIRLYHDGRYQDAEEQARAAIQLDQDNVYGWTCLCVVLEKLWRYEEMEKACWQAVALAPDSPYAQDGLG
ncbi:MAG: hypothetical protein ACRD2L_10560, partial [Terriglobia bacterium]